MSRVTVNNLKNWLEECEFAKSHGMHHSSWNDYHYILNDVGSIIAAGKTTSECWREFTLYRAGYYLALDEMKYNPDKFINRC